MDIHTYNLILLVTQNLIASFGFSEVFSISNVATSNGVTMPLIYVTSTILVRIMQNPDLFFLSSYSSINVIPILLNKL
jgi:hypothetical protein